VEVFLFHSSFGFLHDFKKTQTMIYLLGRLFIMNYTRKDGTPMSKQQAMNDTCRRQNAEIRASKSSAERCDIQRRYAAERQSIMKNYK
jgi:hypothetical protein